jgi:hypothetical protein
VTAVAKSAASAAAPAPASSSSEAMESSAATHSDIISAHQASQVSAMAFSSLGGATLDNEENYLIKKLFTALGAIQIENQARI